MTGALIFVSAEEGKGTFDKTNTVSGEESSVLGWAMHVDNRRQAASFVFKCV